MSRPNPAAPAGSPSGATDPEKARRRAMLSSFLGTTVEYYDFLLYGTAASLVFPVLFFSDLDPLAATIASFATLAAGYFARPIGGIVFGHFGDRLGRKNILIVTLLVMGGASFLMGLLPTQEQIGSLAAVILVTLRLVQGFAVGGEWAGAALMSMEHAGPRGRGFAGSMVASGGPSGAVLATIVLTLFSLLPEEDFLSWGWRVPFLLSGVLVGVALFLRLRVSESPEFEAAKDEAPQSRKAARVPLATVVTKHPGQVVTAVLGALAPLFIQSLLATFFLTYAVAVGHTRTEALLLVTIANAVHIFTIPAFAALSDRVGRKPVMVAGAAAGILLIWPIFWLVQEGSWWTLLLAFVIGNPLVQGLMYGPMAAWIGEKFPTDTRYTGVSLSYQVGSTLGAGLAPLAAAGLLSLGGGTDPSLIAYVFMGLCVVSGIAYLRGREMVGTSLRATTGAADEDAGHSPAR